VSVSRGKLCTPRIVLMKTPTGVCLRMRAGARPRRECRQRGQCRLRAAARTRTGVGCRAYARERGLERRAER